MHTPVPMLRERRVSPARVTLVALGLVPAGAVAGFVAGALGVSIWVGVTEGIAHAFDLGAWRHPRIASQARMAAGSSSHQGCGWDRPPPAEGAQWHLGQGRARPQTAVS